MMIQNLLYGIGGYDDNDVRNVIQKKAEMKLEYKNLSTEIQQLRNMKCFVIPVINRPRELKVKVKKKSGNNTRTTFNRFSEKICHTRNITYHKGKCYNVRLEA
jgi:hypothetical protein